MSERVIRTGYWYVPLPESTRGGQHVGSPRGVLVYDEDLQMGIFSFSERSQFKNVADANALLDLASEASPGRTLIGLATGLAKAIDIVRARRALYDCYTDPTGAMVTKQATFAIIDELLVFLEAEHERATVQGVK